jgi:hypothetical protein
MRPLLTAMSAASGPSAVHGRARNLVAAAVGQSLQHFGPAIGTGWGAALETLRLAAADPCPGVARAAFTCSSSIAAAVRVPVGCGRLTLTNPR